MWSAIQGFVKAALSYREETCTRGRTITLVARKPEQQIADFIGKT